MALTAQTQAQATGPQGAFDAVRDYLKNGEIALAIGILAILVVLLLPLPPWMLDLSLSFSITFAILILMTSVFIRKPLEFSSFPTILLISTMLRVALNLASTRLILAHGKEGTAAAGLVIEAFGRLITQGNFVIGIIVFAILIIVNFVVITKGAGRIAEVAARFTLDAMPGKQMAIDADLNAGLIDDKEAKRRRAEISHEAAFYGAMDGASKYVRGDAVAGILILFINVIGGLAVGTLQHDLEFSQAVNNYVLLTIGDGLVAAIPAIVISIAAGLIVSRVGKEDDDLGGQMLKQVMAVPRALGIASVILAILGIIPGMPWLVFLSFSFLCGYAAWTLVQRAQRAAAAQEVARQPAPEVLPGQEATWDDIVPVDPLGLEGGYRLIPLVDKGQDGELLKRIKAIRKKFAQDISFLPPPVHIRDNLE